MRSWRHTPARGRACSERSAPPCRKRFTLLPRADERLTGPNEWPCRAGPGGPPEPSPIMVDSMALVHPFRALRPRPAQAAAVAAVPYDVVSTEEARSLAAGNPLSFLHVSRVRRSICRPTPIPMRTSCTRRRRANFATAPRAGAAGRRGRAEPVFLPAAHGRPRADRPRRHASRWTSTSATSSRSTSARGRDKEDDRTRHIVELRAQTGVVFLTYRASPASRRVAAQVTAGAPL